MKIQIERISHIIEELFPLWYDHWEEVSKQHYRPEMCPDINMYLELDAQGVYVMVTLRNDHGELCGYVGDVVHTNLHYSTLVAMSDLMYIKPDYRGASHFAEMVETLEQIEEEMGVKERYMSFKDVGPVKKGYQQIERVVFKRLGVA